MTDHSSMRLTRAGLLSAAGRPDLLGRCATPLLERLCGVVIRALGVDYASVELLDGARCVCLASAGPAGAEAGETEPWSAPAAWRARVEAGAPVVLDDGREDAVVCEWAAVRGVEAGAYVEVPLVSSAGEVLGAFCAVDGGARHWSREHVDLLTEMAAVAVDALELSAETEIHRASVDSSLDGVLTVGPDRQVMSYNRRFVEIWGIPEETLATGADRALIDEVLSRIDEPGAFLRRVEDIYAGSGEAVDEIDLRDGRVLSRYALPLRGSGGVRYGRIWHFRDVTEQKRAARALEESEEMFRQIAENVREEFWIYEAGFEKPLYLTPVHREVWGTPVEREYERPRSFLDAVHPEDLPRVQEAMERVSVEKGPGEVEYRIVRPDGSTRWMRSRGFPVLDEHGEVLRVVGTTEDITQSKEAEQALRWMGTIVESSADAITSATPDGLVTSWNAAAEAIFGYSAEEMMGRSWSVIVPPESGDREAPIEARRRKGGQAETYEAIRVRKDGRRIPVSVSAFPILDERGEVAGTAAIIRDISEEVEQQRYLRRAERLASVGTLISGVAHELNNPLHAILSFTQLLLMDSPPPETRQSLETIRREAERMGKIVSDLRLVARRTQEESGARAPVDLNEVVRHVLRTREYSLRTRNVEVREDLAVELPLVLADRAQLEQVVVNLVVNAEQAMDEVPGERLLIVRSRPSDRGVSLHVVDRGPGMPRNILDRIFDPFFTTKGPGQGTGLGLSLVNSIITEHGGEIRVESEIAQGTAVRVDLPVAPTGSSVAAGDGPADAPPRPLRVLVVDDEMPVRVALTRYLRRRGHEVHEASDGARALELIDGAGEEPPYDVIVSDLRMPGLGGDQLLARLRQRGRGMERRLVFLTGDVASELALRVMRDADVPTLTKPAALEDLAAVVERIGTPEDSGGA